jgi:hypothetical protein
VTEKGESDFLSRAAKRLKAREEKKKAAEAAREKEADGGYCVLARGKHRAEGGVIATGDDRTCLPDAMSVIMCMLLSIPLTPSLTKKTIAWFTERVKSDPKRANDHDPNQADAMVFAQEHHFSLKYVPKVSPQILLNYTGGLFLVRLLIHYNDESGKLKMDTHFVVYDAGNGKIIDNMRGMGAIVVDEDDRQNNQSAMQPFYKELFPKAQKIEVKSVCIAEKLSV